jgi:hypothetical protein
MKAMTEVRDASFCGGIGEGRNGFKCVALVEYFQVASALPIKSAMTLYGEIHTLQT